MLNEIITFIDSVVKITNTQSNEMVFFEIVLLGALGTGIFTLLMKMIDVLFIELPRLTLNALTIWFRGHPKKR